MTPQVTWRGVTAINAIQTEDRQDRRELTLSMVLSELCALLFQTFWSKKKRHSMSLRPFIDLLTLAAVIAVCGLATGAEPEVKFVEKVVANGSSVPLYVGNRAAAGCQSVRQTADRQHHAQRLAAAAIAV